MNESNKFWIICGTKKYTDPIKATYESYIPYTKYKNKELKLTRYPGIFKFSEWLPISNNTIEYMVERLPNVSPFKIVKSKKLGEYLGLKNLYFVINDGPTKTFKDIESIGVISIWHEFNINERGIPVFASDGNFGRALFINSQNVPIKFIGVMTQKAINHHMWYTTSYNKESLLVSLNDPNADYWDAIALSQQLVRTFSFLIPEGGTKNIGRLDFVGTIIYEATVRIGKIPDHYFQAVGSGVGPIAIYQASKRLIDEGSFGKHLPQMHLSQNYPFVPIVDAWNSKSKTISHEYMSKETALKLINQIRARVLSNRHPAYSIPGGLFDVLRDTKGYAYSVTNEEIEYAKTLFKRLENIDIGPSSAVAVYSLIKALNSENIQRDDVILVNITDVKPPNRGKQNPPNIVIESPNSILSFLKFVQSMNKH